MSGAAKQYDSQPVLCVSWHSLVLEKTCGFVQLGNVFMPINASRFVGKIAIDY